MFGLFQCLSASALQQEGAWVMRRLELMTITRYQTHGFVHDHEPNDSVQRP
jgi:hypothetical protein